MSFSVGVDLNNSEKFYAAKQPTPAAQAKLAEQAAAIATRETTGSSSGMSWKTNDRGDYEAEFSRDGVSLAPSTVSATDSRATNAHITPAAYLSKSLDQFKQNLSDYGLDRYRDAVAATYDPRKFRAVASEKIAGSLGALLVSAGGLPPSKLAEIRTAVVARLRQEVHGKLLAAVENFVTMKVVA